MNLLKRFTALSFSFLILGTLVQCSSSSGSSSSSNTTEVDTSVLASRVSSSTSALLPDMTSSGDANIIPRALTYSDSTTWDTYIDEDNIVYLEDIFGNDESGPVTQIRVLVSQFSDNLEEIFQADPDVNCTGSTALTADSDTIEIAFYESISNGTSGNRFFQCFSQTSDQTLLYGKDDDNVVRVVYMADLTDTNTEQVESRGDQARLLQVVYATYGEATESDVDVAYLDLQYAQATSYNGVDDSFGTDDDNIFKSRSRITGRITLDSEGAPVTADGDFSVIKFDQSLNESDEVSTITTKTLGRGSFGEGDFALFNIDSDVDAFDSIPGTFCLETPAGASPVPTHAESSNCTSLETAFAWGSATFPFDLEPELTATFEDADFYTAEDLVDAEGDNFTIPTYE